MGEPMKIPQIVLTLRERAHMTQSQLDEAAGLPVSTISRVERGKMQLKANYLLRIIDATGHEFVIRRKEETK